MPSSRGPLSSIRWLWQRGCLAAALVCSPLLPVRRAMYRRRPRPAGHRPGVENLEDRVAAADTVGIGLALGALDAAAGLAAVQVRAAPDGGSGNRASSAPTMADPRSVVSSAPPV